MEGSGDKPLPEERAVKGGRRKTIAIAVVIILIVAVIAGALILNAGNNAKPSASFSVTNPKVNLGQAVGLDASASTGKITNYTWTMGDGNVQFTTVPFLNYTYENAGTYYVTLLVSVGTNTATSDSQLVTVNSITGALGQTTLEAFISSSSAALQNKVLVDNVVSFDGSLSTAYIWNGSARSPVNGTGIDNYTWMINGAVVGYGVSYTKNFTSAGMFVVSLTISNNTLGLSNTYVVTMIIQTVNSTSGKTFTMVTIGQPQTLDPAVDYETSGGEILQNVYETLVWYNGSSASQLVPLLATEVPTTANGDISSNGLNYTFHLREGVKFHDGTNTMTSADVKYSIERLLMDNNPTGPAWILGQVLIPNYSSVAYANQSQMDTAITTPDNYTVVFHLTHAYPAFLYCMAFTEASVVSMAYVQAHGGIVGGTDNQWMTTHEDGTGPYELVNWASNQYILMQSNQNYWRTTAAIQYVIIKEVSDVGSRELLLFNGDADSAYIPRNHASDVENQTFLNITQGNPTFDIDFLGLNEKINTTNSVNPVGSVPSTFFADKNVRLAFSSAFNYSNYLSVGLGGSAVQPNGVIPSGMFGYNASIPKYNFDLVAAAQYLKNTTNPSTGTSYADSGFTIYLYYNEGNDVRQFACDLLQNGLQALKAQSLINGTITVKVQALDWPTFVSAEQHGQLAAFYLGWAPDYADPDDYVSPFVESAGTYASTLGIINPGLTNLSLAASSELNSTLRAEMYSNVSLQVYHDAYYIWTDQQTTFHVQRDWVTGYYFNPMYSGLYYYALDINKNA